MSELTTPPSQPNQPPPPPPPSPAPPHAPSVDSSVLIRQYPKIVFLYPTLFFSIIAWAMEGISKNPEWGVGSPRLGAIFFCIFAINLLVISFEFSRMSSVALLLLATALVFAFLYFDLFPWLKTELHKIDIRMNTHFYAAMSILLLIIFGIVFLNSRVDYYEIKHNEILRHHGYLGDIERYPSPNLKMQKEIHDLLEYLLLRSGRLVLQPATESRAIVMENVIGINRVEARIQQLLGRIAVEIEKDK